MSAEFLGSFVATRELPERKEPKVAFLGRSNVGKSSLINLLAGSPIARISKSPGRTQTLNLYRIECKIIFGDFPGYGYARVSKEMRRQWKDLIERFLNLEIFSYAIHVVDARHPGLKPDLQLLDWLEFQKMPYLIVLNKCDKMNQKERVEAGRKVREVFSGRPLLFASAFTKEGKQELEKKIQKMMLGSYH